MADGVDPEEFLRELTSFNEEPKAAKPEVQSGAVGNPTSDPQARPEAFGGAASHQGGPGAPEVPAALAGPAAGPGSGIAPEQGRGRRKTEAPAVVASDGRRTVDQDRIRAGSGAVAGTGRAGTATAVPPEEPTDDRKSLVGLLVAAVLTVLVLSWIATSCLADDDSTINAGGSTETTEADSTDESVTSSTSTTSTTAPSTTAAVADLGADAAAALAGAGIEGITATANGSTIVLTGAAADEEAKAAAQAIVEGLAGVEAVDNQITVAAARDINAEANAALMEAGITGVTATVAGDVATLTGEAANGEQRLAAELLMLGIGGIESVDNQITLPPTPAEILTGTLNEIVLANPIQFSTGSADIRSESQPILEQVAQVLATNPDGAVEIGGHTDSDGGADGNRELSQDRAQSVLDYLVGQGVDPARLTAVGYGEDAPLVPNDSGDNKRKNRRIEFKVS